MDTRPCRRCEMPSDMISSNCWLESRGAGKTRNHPERTRWTRQGHESTKPSSHERLQRLNHAATQGVTARVRKEQTAPSTYVKARTDETGQPGVQCEVCGAVRVSGSGRFRKSVWGRRDHDDGRKQGGHCCAVRRSAVRSSCESGVAPVHAAFRRTRVEAVSVAMRFHTHHLTQRTRTESIKRVGCKVH